MLRGCRTLEHFFVCTLFTFIRICYNEGNISLAKKGDDLAMPMLFSNWLSVILWAAALVVLLAVEANTFNLVTIWFAVGALAALITRVTARASQHFACKISLRFVIEKRSASGISLRPCIGHLHVKV